MAKVGEGDPRWIVAERKDGANVNSWHWEERDLSQHTHAQLKERLAGLAVPCAQGATLTVDELSEISGDVTVAQRKGKMMCYFELKMTLQWSGKAKGSKELVKGKMIIPEVDHDEFKNDYEITVSCQDNTPAAQKMEDAIRQAGRKVVRQAVQEYFDALFKEYHIGEMLKSGASMPAPPPPPSSKSDKKNEKEATAASTSSQNGKDSSFSWKMRWKVPVEQLYTALTDSSRASAYTRSAAQLDVKAGGQFSYLGGVISGYYVDVQSPTMIKQQWRLGSWPVGIHSSVVMRLVKEEPDVTLLEYAQSGIPAGQLQSVQEGMRANFFDAMKSVFGYSMDYI